MLMFKRKQKQPTVIIDEFNPFPSGKKPSKLKAWIAAHKKLAIILGVLIVLLLAGGGVAAYYFVTSKPADAEKVVQAPKPKPAPEPEKFYSPLTGAQVETKAATTQAATGIMIENSPDARPQSGLKDSGVVFEAIAEGGITRFLALYQEQKPQLIGPVRSVRMYYVDWVAAFNASVAHIGGSAAALAEVRNGSYRDIDQFFNAPYYWRATDRYAPHNVYTSFAKLDELNAAKGYTSSTFTGFSRKDTKASETPTATSVNVQVSSALFNSTYTYNATTNTYDRSQGGAPHLDRESGQISPRVVIAMKIDQQRVFEDGWREQIAAIGSGTAYIFQDGTVQEVKWAKASKAEQIKFTTPEGADVPLARGQTWITAVPNGTGGVSWQ